MNRWMNLCWNIQSRLQKSEKIMRVRWIQKLSGNQNYRGLGWLKPKMLPWRGWQIQSKKRYGWNKVSSTTRMWAEDWKSLHGLDWNTGRCDSSGWCTGTGNSDKISGRLPLDCLENWLLCTGVPAFPHKNHIGMRWTSGQPWFRRLRPSSSLETF